MASRDAVKQAEMKTKKMSIGRLLLCICPYTHLWDVVKTSVKKRKLTATMRSGVLIFLLGLCCPIFWVALFSGASHSELMMHGTHSAIVAGMGLFLIIIELITKK
jgi:hypothetical protein